MQKVHTALEAGLIPIVCCGETPAQRESGVTTEWITMQIKLACRCAGGEDPPGRHRL